MIQDRRCRQCNVVFQGGPRAYYCPTHRAERQKQTNAEYRLRKQQGVARAIGSTDKCERCGTEYIVAGGLQRFCADCQPIHKAEHDRETALNFYHDNKERINPPRKIKRRKRGNNCLWCGNVFKPINGSVTCSVECRKHHKARIARERRQKKKQP